MLILSMILTVILVMIIAFMICSTTTAKRELGSDERRRGHMNTSCVYIHICIYTCIIQLSNTTCLTPVFFKRDQSCSKLD